MVEEKKLTDEEVIEVLKNCGAGIRSSNRECWNCVLEADGRCVNNLRKYTLDLIHRLQNTEKANEEAWEIKEESYKRQIAEQKAEIERLTAEINQRREMMSRMDCNYATEIQKNAELQEQVDELKFDKELLQKIIDKREKDTAKEIYDYIKSIEEHGLPTSCVGEWVKNRLKERYGVEVE